MTNEQPNTPQMSSIVTPPGITPPGATRFLLSAASFAMIATLMLMVGCGGPERSKKKATTDKKSGSSAAALLPDEDDLEGQVRLWKGKLKATRSSNEDYPAVLERLALAHVDYADELDERAEKEQKPELTQEATAQRKAAVERFEQLLQDYPRYEGVPSSMFLLAFEYEKLDRTDEAWQTREALLEKHSGSKWATEAQLQLADYYFEQQALERALELYQLFLGGGPDPARAAYARYKTGWVHFNLEAYPEAFSAFEELAINPNLPDALRKQARHDAVIVMGAMDVSDAKGYLALVDQLTETEDQKSELIEKLKQQLQNDGKGDIAAEL